MGKEKKRLLPLHPMVVPLIKSYMGSLEEYQLHPSQPVFLNKNGKKLNPRGLHKIFKIFVNRHFFYLHNYLVSFVLHAIFS